VPNTITLFRLALVPFFLWLYWTQPPEWALGCFLLAAISDVLDGLFARLLNQRTKLGGILDPIADKLLIFAALLVLVLEGRLPLWLLLINAFRDLLMVAGALMVTWKNLEIPTQPSRVGKYATFALICLVALALAGRSPYAPGLLRAYIAVMAFLSALCVTISTLQYFTRYGYLWVAPRRPRLPGGMRERLRG
jgi:cardiolipin synthase